MICNFLSRASDTEHDDPMGLIQPHDLPDMPLQILNGIPESLTSKTSETVDILTDLAGVQLHSLSQIPAGNLGHTLRFQLPQVPVVGRQSPDHRV